MSDESREALESNDFADDSDFEVPSGIWPTPSMFLLEEVGIRLTELEQSLTNPALRAHQEGIRMARDVVYDMINELRELHAREAKMNRADRRAASSINLAKFRNSIG
jgi:hypothetical protein